jgi:hypothetical protein
MPCLNESSLVSLIHKPGRRPSRPPPKISHDIADCWKWGNCADASQVLLKHGSKQLTAKSKNTTSHTSIPITSSSHPLPLGLPSAPDDFTLSNHGLRILSLLAHVFTALYRAIFAIRHNAKFVYRHGDTQGLSMVAERRATPQAQHDPTCNILGSAVQGINRNVQSLPQVHPDEPISMPPLDPPRLVRTVDDNELDFRHLLWYTLNETNRHRFCSRSRS